MENSKPIGRRSPNVRSRVSNGDRPLLGCDGRSGWIRRWKDIVEDHAADYGGAENMSVPRMTMLRHQAAALVEMEQLKAKMADGKATFEELDQFNRLFGNVRRNYELMGIERIARPTNDGSAALTDYFAAPRPKAP